MEPCRKGKEKKKKQKKKEKEKKRRKIKIKTEDYHEMKLREKLGHPLGHVARDLTQD